MKRGREDIESFANCLMLLSRGGELPETMTSHSPNPNRVFECKTCNKQFASFQALGGHRASHKKPRLMEGGDSYNQMQNLKPKTHECSICGLEFAIGQALGGHMRRHRNKNMSESLKLVPPPSPKKQVPVLKRSNSKRIFGLDLNLTPLENGLELFQFGKTSPWFID